MWLTSSGLQVQAQQMPSFKLWAGNLKTPAMNFQSALTSTRQDLCTALPAFLFVSDLSHGLPSCLVSAGWPAASMSRDHFTTDMISCHVLGPFCFSPKHVMGILIVLLAPVRPGRLSDKTANDSDLSQLHGHSSPLWIILWISFLFTFRLAVQILNRKFAECRVDTKACRISE